MEKWENVWKDTCRGIVKAEELSQYAIEILENIQPDGNFPLDSFFSMLPGSPVNADGSENRFWTPDGGMEVLARTEEDAERFADLVEKQVDETQVVTTGYYDPVEDERMGEVDRCTGWYYITL